MLSEERIESNKKGLGKVIKEHRAKVGMTQKDLAAVLDIEYYTMVSQMELGYMSIPPSLWGKLARALDMDKHVWALRCLHTYQPDVFKALFGHASIDESADYLRRLEGDQS
jgi:DNA-binding XRE family transcriptional regulator